MKHFFNKKFWIWDIEVTIKEIILSIAIISVLLIMGLFISNKIYENKLDSERKYNTAVKIDNDANLFEYGMNTNIGHAFVYGPLKAVDTVSYPDIDGEYLYLKKVKERYTMHTRTVTYTTGSGDNKQTHTKIEHYWTWDYVDSESQKSKQIQFLDSIFDSNIISIPNEHYIDTIEESSTIRYVYYGVDKEHIGTIFTELKNNTISSCEFHKDMTIEDTLNYYTLMDWRILFWIFWILLMGGILFAFISFENRWME